MKGIELIAIERREQIEKHHRTIKDDVSFNTEHQLSLAASILCQPNLTDSYASKLCPPNWSVSIWNKMSCKSYKDRLVIAGALIAAEIDRLQT